MITVEHNSTRRTLGGRIATMVKLLMEAEREIDQAQRGQVVFDFAGASVEAKMTRSLGDSSGIGRRRRDLVE